jgi:hypothetical protein
VAAEQGENYQEILERALEASGAERGCIVTPSPETGLPDIVASLHWDEPTADDQDAFKTVSSHVMVHKNAIITTNANLDKSFQIVDDFRVYILRSILCVPFRMNNVFGAVYLDCPLKKHFFSGEDTQRIQALLTQP